MRYVIARYKAKQRDDAYRSYISEGIRMISLNTAYAASGLCGGKCDVSYLGRGLDDILSPRPQIMPGEGKKRIIDKLNS